MPYRCENNLRAAEGLIATLILMAGVDAASYLLRRAWSR
jgi:hypothetical protein